MFKGKERKSFMTFLLTKIFLKTSIQKFNDKNNPNANKKGKLQLALYLFLFAYLAGIIIFFSTQIIDSLREVNQETTFIGLIFLAVLLTSAMQAIFSGINLLYFSKDTDAVLTLPLKPYQIILARTNVLILAEYLTNLFVGILPLIIYGVTLNCGPMYYVTAILGVLLLPILPIILVSLLMMIIMSFSKITKNKNKFQMAATFIVLILVIFLSIGITKLEDSNMTDEQMQQIMMQADGMINNIKGYFPTLDFAINAVTTSNMLSAILEFAKIIGITIVGVIIYVLLAQKLYFKGLIGSLYGGNSKKTGKVKISQKKSSIGKAYIGKEFKLLLRSPIYLMQCILPALLMPILMIVLLLMSGGEELRMQLETLTTLVGTNNALIIMGLLGITQFFSIFIYVSITAISRDGSNAVFMKYIPVSLYKQYIYKTVPNIIISVIPLLIILGVAKYLLNGLKILDLVIIFMVSLLMYIVHSFLSLLIDLKRPKLQWNSEYAVVKQNFNLLFPMIFGFINIGIVVFVNYALSAYSVYIQLGIIALIYIIAWVIINAYLYKRQKNLASKII